MRQERYTGHRTTKRSLIIAGRDTEIAVPFQDLAVILEELSKEIAPMAAPQEKVVAIGWSGSRQRTWLDFVKQEQPYVERQ